MKIPTQKDLTDYAQWRKDEEMKDADELIKWQNNNPDKDLEKNENYRMPLSITKYHTIKIELSTGGEADGFILEFTNDKELNKAKYYWADQDVYREIYLTDEEAEKIYNLYLYGDISAFIE